MMTPEQFKLLGTLPGLYYARDQIQAEIDRIEHCFAIASKPVKELAKPRKLNDEARKKRSEAMKAQWANMTPEQKKIRRDKMTRAIRKTHRAKKALAAAQNG